LKINYDQANEAIVLPADQAQNLEEKLIEESMEIGKN
jgi:hypothetical protein